MYYYNDGDIYEGDWKMVNMKEKESIIVMMVIDVKVILQMVNMKEKEFFIIIMVIGKWEIIQKMNQQESM